jgi:hypothetical protein
VAIHERDHSVDRGMEWILTQLRQIDVSGAGFEQRLYAQSLLDDVIVRSTSGTPLPSLLRKCIWPKRVG